MLTSIKNYFHFKKHNTSLKTEILAGISTFLSISYIFVVNPTILSDAGIDKSLVFFATIIVSSIATIIMGLRANKPFSLAPGLEMNSYIAYVVVGTMGFVRQDALGAVFWSGVIMIIVNILRIREQIITAIPSGLKSGLAASVGIFLVLIALKISGITLYEGIALQGIGSMSSPEAIVFFVGLISLVVFRFFSIKGSVLLSIICSSVFAYFLGLTQHIEPVSLSSDLLQSMGQVNIGVIANSSIFSVIVLLFIIDFYGSIAKFIGLTRHTTIVDKDGSMPQMKEALHIDGGATVIGAALGTTNVTTYVESAVGIGEGGRTGFTSIVSGLLMLFFLFLTPLINLVPVAATTGALCFVGLSLLPKKQELHKENRVAIVSILIMCITTIFTFGLDKAMLAGFGAYIILTILNGKLDKVNPYLVGSTIILGLTVLL